MAADEEGPGVTEHARHVTDELCRSADSGGRAEAVEVRRGTAEGLLGAIGQGGQEVTQQSSLLIHGQKLP